MTTHSSYLHYRRAAAFTLIELLVVLAIIFVLVGVVLVALRSARAGAERAESLNSLRQMTAGYIAYASENDGLLMPGYVRAQDFIAGGGALDINARLKSGYDLDSAGTAAANDASSYVWRLAPYLDHNWIAYFNDSRDKQLVSRLEAEYGNGSASGAYGPASISGTELGIARVPSYGLNSIFLGGDSFHGPADHSPWNDGKRAYVASRMSEVLNPTKIIVFGASEAKGVALPNPTGVAGILGYCELRAPQVMDAAGNPVLQWSIDTTSGSPTEGQVVYTGGGPAGVPVSRLPGDKIPISHLDGHVEAESLGRLSADMSRWAPNAISAQ